MKKSYDFSKAQKGKFYRPEDQFQVTINYTTTNSRSKFEIYHDKDGMYRFRLISGTGDIIHVSDIYKTKNDCLQAIEALRTSSMVATTEECTA